MHCTDDLRADSGSFHSLATPAALTRVRTAPLSLGGELVCENRAQGFPSLLSPLLTPASRFLVTPGKIMV